MYGAIDYGATSWIRWPSRCTMTGGATDLVRLPGSEGPVDSAIVKSFGHF